MRVALPCAAVAVARDQLSPGVSWPGSFAVQVVVLCAAAAVVGDQLSGRVGAGTCLTTQATAVEMPRLGCNTHDEGV